jgi:cellobiose phosphorylase
LRDSFPYRIRHGQGYTRYEHNSEGIVQNLTVFVPREDPVKICHLRLRNVSKRSRILTITYFVEWVLGSQREQQQVHISTSFASESSAVLAQQNWSGAFENSVAFIASVPHASSYTGDRISFFGRDGVPDHPDSLSQARLDNQCGVALDPCGALQVAVSILPEEEREVIFLLGQSPSTDDAKKLIDRYGAAPAINEEFKAVVQRWDRLLGTVQVHSPTSRWISGESLASLSNAELSDLGTVGLISPAVL